MKYISIGLDNFFFVLYIHRMKISIRYNQLTKMETNSLGKEMVDFANLQFKSLVKKHLGVPVKTFRL